MASAVSILKILLGKMHFIAALAMFFFIALMVVTDSTAARALLLLPVVICYAASRILQSIDAANSVQDIVERQKRR